MSVGALCVCGVVLLALLRCRGEGGAAVEVVNASQLEALGAGAWAALWASTHRPVLQASPAQVSVRVGDTAHLRCSARHAPPLVWVRRRDWHILSSGSSMYTSDERFQVLHAAGSDDWVLQIKYVQRRDNGTYECQVPTPRGAPLAARILLLVSEPEAFILGSGELHVRAGSTLSLVCIVEKSPSPPQYVFWYQDERMVNHDGARGVTVRTVRTERTQSTLRVRASRPEHAGNYTCRAPGAPPARVAVHVVTHDGHEMAATLTGNCAPAPRRAALSSLLALLAAATL